jgi:hypothetical protein
VVLRGLANCTQPGFGLELLVEKGTGRASLSPDAVVPTILRTLEVEKAR